MEIFEKTGLWLHIIAGHGALIFGLVAMMGKKGTKRHIFSGRVFYYSMVVVSITAISLSLIKQNWFLLHIGIFVFYQAHAGFRAATFKSLKPNFWDLLLMIAAAINGVVMVLSLKVVLMVFGFISLSLVAGDLRLYYQIFKVKKIAPKQWLARHIGMMIGGYIGTVTAFLVVNVNPQMLGLSNPYYGVALWLAPTFLLVPLMIFWQRKHAGNLKPKTS